MHMERDSDAADLVSQGYAPLKVIDVLKENGMSEEEATVLVESLLRRKKNSKTARIWHAILAAAGLMILCALLWALIAYQTGSDFVLINILIGAAIGYLMHSVSKNAPHRIIPIMAAFFAILSIFLGDVIFHIIYWYKEFAIEAGATPIVQYMITTGFWSACWDIITNRNLMDVFWMCLSGVVAYFSAR